MRVLSMFKGWAMTLAATSQIKHFLTERRAITKGKQLCFTDTHTHSCIFFLFFCDSLSPVYLLEFLCPSSLLHPRSHPVTDHLQLVVTKSPWCRLWNLQLVPTPFKKKNRGGAISWPSRKYMCICSISSQPPKISLFKLFNWEWNVSWTDHNHKTLGLKNVLFFPTPLFSFLRLLK